MSFDSFREYWLINQANLTKDIFVLSLMDRILLYNGQVILKFDFPFIPNNLVGTKLTYNEIIQISLSNSIVKLDNENSLLFLKSKNINSSVPELISKRDKRHEYKINSIP